MEQSLILSNFLNGELYYIPKITVQRLIKNKEIKSFRRSNCWVDVENDPRKNGHLLYEGPDRRIYEKINRDFFSLTIKEQLKKDYPIEDIIGYSSIMSKIIEQIKLVANTDLSVLILGETGTGKSVAAAVIHELSSRKCGPFIDVDCGAIPEALIESELFGHEKGAFTGACEKTVGKFQLANGGTIFLDEIGNLPMAMQIKLLRCLDEKIICPVGGTKPVELDIRIITATNHNLMTDVEKSNFREDLYYRINQFEFYMPSLRERPPEDILFYAKKFLAMANIEFKKNVLGFSKEVRDVLIEYPWPGNIREIKNFINRSVLLSDRFIDIEFLPKSIQDSLPTENETMLAQALDGYLEKALAKDNTLNEIIQRIEEEAEKSIIEKVYEQSGKNKTVTSRVLGIGYTTLYRKIKKYKL